MKHANACRLGAGQPRYPGDDESLQLSARAATGEVVQLFFIYASVGNVPTLMTREA